MKRVKKYDEEFRQSATRLVLEGGQKIGEVAAHLGVGHSTLNTWLRNARLMGTRNLSDKSPLKREEIELRAALKKLRIVEEERDILKKALGIFSQPNK